MKAGKVKRLDPAMPLADGLHRTITVRLQELCAFMPAVRDPARVRELHDMRIAAKRLRYILDVSAGLFGPYLADATQRVKALQEVLGDIHDCDVTLPIVTTLIHEAREQDAAAVTAAVVAAGGDDVQPGLLRAAAPLADTHRGLAAMAVWLQARRDLRFAHFLKLWLSLEREGLAARLLFAVHERPPATIAPPSSPRLTALPALTGDAALPQDPGALGSIDA